MLSMPFKGNKDPPPSPPTSPNEERIESQKFAVNTRLKRIDAWAVQGDLVSRFCILPHRQNTASTERSKSRTQSVKRTDCSSLLKVKNKRRSQTLSRASSKNFPRFVTFCKYLNYKFHTYMYNIVI